MTDTTVCGTMNYIADMAEAPFVNVHDFAQNRLELESHEVEFHDAWPLVDTLSFDREGFRLIEHRTLVRDFRDPVDVETVHLPEMERVVQEATGADFVISARAPILRFSNPAESAQVPPAPLAHSDYTELTLRKQMACEIAADDPRIAGCKQVVAYQTWRAFSPPPQDSTLAFCDARSVSAEDRVRSEFWTLWPEPMQLEFYIYRYNPAHRWHYFPNLGRNHLLLFKGFEGDGADCANMLHGAMTLPGPPAGAVPRESIETRAFAFFR